MMGVQAASAQLFYDFCLDDHVPCDHLLRGIDGHLELEGLGQTLKPFYSRIGRPSIDPELTIRMLMVGYCMGIRSERRLCEEFIWRAWVVNSVGFGWPGGKRSEGFRLLCVLNARRRRRTGWVEKDRTA